MKTRKAPAGEFKSYSERLRDPRWQKRRLDIMNRDEFKCRECGDKETTLNVHHGHYEKGKMPWDYPDDSLITLCEQCHTSFSYRIARISRAVGLSADRQIAVMRFIDCLTSMDEGSDFSPWKNCESLKHVAEAFVELLGSLKVLASCEISNDDIKTWRDAAGWNAVEIGYHLAKAVTDFVNRGLESRGSEEKEAA